MTPFYLQIEIESKPLTITVEQLDPLSDDDGFMRYQVASFNHHSVICVNDGKSFGEDETFTTDEIQVIATAIKEYNNGRILRFDQMAFDF
ncbi:hypothetical protein [Mucilaginibacter aquatilis]|uniref:Uncharacterized protein n=1 Tax=Mucilaginibacter aquatilis TaxID=1517760 RepID=A0A6I4ID55_9SPHI|nr:hypothetical protein [Mucilaginibacter aquatilis]MVN91526.1 hypothetical protein [Mucilaginibacter aquatilis]